MSEEIALALADGAASIAAIRARWAGVAWSYEDADGDVYLVADGPDATIEALCASRAECATLQLAAQAPADIARLIEEIERLRADCRRQADQLAAAARLSEAVERWRFGSAVGGTLSAAHDAYRRTFSTEEL